MGTVSYLVGGFGWPRTMEIEAGKFQYPRLYTLLSRLAGPIANLLLANIAASIVYLMKLVEYDPRGFLMVIGVNVTTAIYNLLPLPPLTAGMLIYLVIPESYSRSRWVFLKAGPLSSSPCCSSKGSATKGSSAPTLHPYRRGLPLYERIIRASHATHLGEGEGKVGRGKSGSALKKAGETIFR